MVIMAKRPGIYIKGEETLESMSSFESQILWRKHNREPGSQLLLSSLRGLSKAFNKPFAVKRKRARVWKSQMT